MDVVLMWCLNQNECNVHCQVYARQQKYVRCHYFYSLPSHADKTEAPIDLLTPDNAVRTQMQTLACTHRSV